MLRRRLKALAQTPAHTSLKGILRGLEKESLRISPDGLLAATPHPMGLGSALTHPQITTDYSEALLEFITQPLDTIPALLQQLDDIHRFTYGQLALTGERLWPASMPCKLPEDPDIPVARYGSSNSGAMKTIYRIGLGHRYGRSMQTIAGVHYNFSLPDDFWRALQAQQADTQSLQDFKTEQYFALIRNFRRYFWLLVYLFGAAPAVSNEFVRNRPHRLQALGEHSQYLPFATSLRMGDLGYQSHAQEALVVCYNHVDSYLQSLCGAMFRGPWQRAHARSHETWRGRHA
jgi:glutamate--cysteine ligase